MTTEYHLQNRKNNAKRFYENLHAMKIPGQTGNGVAPLKVLCGMGSALRAFGVLEMLKAKRPDRSICSELIAHNGKAATQSLPMRHT